MKILLPLIVLLAMPMASAQTSDPEPGTIPSCDPPPNLVFQVYCAARVIVFGEIEAIMEFTEEYRKAVDDTLTCLQDPTMCDDIA